MDNLDFEDIVQFLVTNVKRGTLDDFLNLWHYDKESDSYQIGSVRIASPFIEQVKLDHSYFGKMFSRELRTAQNLVNTLGDMVEYISDGHHTFKELYDFRKMYNASLFNEWAKSNPPTYDVHKSWKHNDGKLCFGGGWFIVVALLPSGQISNHYPREDWDLFKIPEVEVVKYPYDGHTPNDVLRRLRQLSNEYSG